jgi:hypothetical protein
VTRVYLDVEAVEIAGSAEHRLDETAARALRFLSDAGHEVVLVTGGRTDTLPAELRGLAAEVIPAVPMRPDVASWYLTTEVERCQGTSARLHTVLIGAAPPAGSIHRCDAVARDVQAAALELLASEAMPGTPGVTSEPAADPDVT